MKRLLVLGIVTVAILSAGCGGPGGAPKEDEPVPETGPAEPIENESAATLGSKLPDVPPAEKTQPIGPMIASDGNSATELYVYV